MTKREDIECLKRRVALLEQRVVDLMTAAEQSRDIKHPLTQRKTFEQIQKDWSDRNNGALVHHAPKIKDLTKGPLPYAHKTGHVGKMTVGDNGG